MATILFIKKSGDSKIAKLIYNSNKPWFLYKLTTTVSGVYKPTYNLGVGGHYTNIDIATIIKIYNH